MVVTLETCKRVLQNFQVSHYCYFESNRIKAHHIYRRGSSRLGYIPFEIFIVFLLSVLIPANMWKVWLQCDNQLWYVYYICFMIIFKGVVLIMLRYVGFFFLFYGLIFIIIYNNIQSVYILFFYFIFNYILKIL